MSRMDRVNQQIKKEVATIVLQDLADPRLSFVSITRVDTSSDLKNAHVYFSILGGPAQAEEINRILTKAGGYIRRIIGQRIRLRYTPRIVFMYDDSLDFTTKMDATLKEFNDGLQDSTQNNSEA